MNLLLRSTLFCVALACGHLADLHAATVWDEASMGDLSNDGMAPTVLSTAIGANLITGTTGNHGQGVDRDYFSFTVPGGAVLSSIILLGNTSVSGSVSFIGIQKGGQLTVTPSGGSAEQLIAFGHYGRDDIGTDLLPAIQIGGSGPLQSGTYSVWVQETGGSVDYGFNVVLSAVPEPQWMPLTCVACLTGATIIRRRRWHRG